MPTTTLSNLFSRDFGQMSVGQEFTTMGRTVTEADIIGFAALTGDWHPQHSNIEWAKNSFFGERIAHGMLVVSYAVALVPFDPQRLVALRRAEAHFKDAVRIGDTIHAEGKIVQMKPLDERFSIVTGSWKILNQRGKTVVRAKFDVVWRHGELDDRVAGPPPEADPS